MGQLYERLLPDHGAFVEIGAYDGVSVSNTVMLAEAGWRGLYVEPHPKNAALCAHNHADKPWVKVVPKAIRHLNGRTILYLHGECSTTVWDQNAIDWGCKSEHSLEVDCVTLDKLLVDEVWQSCFELLVIDVEQAETAVLEGFTLAVWQPRVVIIEAHEKDPHAIRNSKAAKINEYFDKGGYKKIYADHINSIFTAPGVGS